MDITTDQTHKRERINELKNSLLEKKSKLKHKANQRKQKSEKVLEPNGAR